jgi:competence protein ComEC
MREGPNRKGFSKAAVAATPEHGVFAGSWPAFAWLPAMRAQLAAALDLEWAHRRFFLWLPVAMGIGVLLYFAADEEPSLWAPLLGFAVFSGLAFVARHRIIPFCAMVACSAVMAGFLSMTWRTTLMDAPKLERPLIGLVSGHVESLDLRRQGARLLIRVGSVEGLAPEKTPRYVRVTTRWRPTASAGDFISVKSRLLPPPEAARPGGYDFSREAFFRGIGGVGSTLSPVIPATMQPKAPFSTRLFAHIDHARNGLTERIALIIGGEAGALSAALVTGKRDLISEPTNEALRAAGLYHIVSISGLHMVLAAGVFFWLARTGLALVPGLALRWPIKKIAAAFAMLGASAYCIFTGSEVATQRSLVMVLVMLGAVLVDRPALALRNLAISAILILLIEPETLVGPSFQMSYAAVLGLVAAAEWWRETGRDYVATNSRGGRIAVSVLLWAAGLIATTLIATLATAPFSSYHFQRFNPYGIIGNALALPFVSMIVMPAAVLGVLLRPFGLDGFVWSIMGYGTHAVVSVAQAVAAWPGSVRGHAAFDLGALFLIAFGLIWLCVWRTRLRILAVLPILTGTAVAMTAKPQDLFIDRSGSGAAFRMSDGRLALVGRPSRFVTSFWLQADGDTRAPSDVSLKAGSACDKLGCIGFAAAGRSIAVVTDAMAFLEDCRRADVIITPLDAPGWCQARHVFDRKRLRESGSVSLRFGEPDRITTQRAVNAARPWQARPWQERPEAPSANAETSAVPAATPGGTPPQPAEQDDDLSAASNP